MGHYFLDIQYLHLGLIKCYDLQKRYSIFPPSIKSMITLLLFTSWYRYRKNLFSDYRMPLIIMTGLPSSGKSTAARKIQKFLQAKGKEAEILIEGKN